MNANATSPATRGHYPWLDLVRGLAAVMVMLGHLRLVFFPSFNEIVHGPSRWLAGPLCLLVQPYVEAMLIFFVLSGFLVGGRTIQKMRDGSFNLRKYAVDRVSRIIPPMLGAIALIVLLQWLVFDYPIPWEQVLGDLLMLQEAFFHNSDMALIPFWSLAYEIWFYVLIGSLGVLYVWWTNSCHRGPVSPNPLAPNGRPWWMSWRWIAVLTVILPIAYYALAETFNAIILLVATIVGALRLPRRGSWKRLLLLLALLAGSVLLRQMAQESMSHDMIPIPRGLSEDIYGFMAVLVCRELAVLTPTGKWGIRLNRFGEKLAAFSYSLYLTHNFVIFSFGTIGWHDLYDAYHPWTMVYYFIEAATTIVVAYGFYLLIERHTPRIRRWMLGSKPTK